MANLHRKISEKEEREFHLRSKDFFRPPLKQIGNSIYEIKSHYMSRGPRDIIPSQSSAHLAGVRDILLRHLDDDSFLFQNHIVTGSTIEHTADQDHVPGFVMLMDSLVLAMDIEIDTRPGDVLCDILIAICGQPVIVLTLVDGDKDSSTVKLYNASVGRGVTSKLRQFTNESVNLISGVLGLQDMETKDSFETSITSVAKASARFVTSGSLKTNPSKYEKLVTAMVEVARRLRRLENTLLVCGSQEEKERLKFVYPNIETVARLRLTDLSKYTNIVDETGTVTGRATGKLWSFRKVYSELEQLEHIVETLERQNENTEKMIYLLSSADRRDTMNHLSLETEVLKLFDISFQGLLAAYLLPGSLVHEIDPVKRNPGDQGDRDRRLETEDYMRRVLRQLKRGINRRRDLFPLLGDMMKQVKGILPYLQAKTDYLELATSGNLQTEDREKQTGVSVDEGLPILDHEKHVKQTDKEDETVSTKSSEPESEEIPQVHGGNPGVSQSRGDDMNEVAVSENTEELKKKLEALKTEADQKQQELREVRAGTDYGVEWEFNMNCLSQNMAQLKIQDVITDVIGEDQIPVISDKQMKPNGCLDGGSSTRCLTYHLRKLQFGTLRQQDLMDIVRDVITVDQERLTNLRTQSDRLERVYGSPVHIVGEVETEHSGPVSCPPMTFNRERVYEWLTVSGDGLEMVNSWSGDHHDGQYRKYWGTCSRLPIPLPLSPSTLTVPQYWETHSRVQVEGRLYYPFLEMGLCGEGEVDTETWVYLQTRSSWSVIVRDCDEHDGYCTQVWENGRQVGGCHDTVSPTPGTHLIYKWGIALDMGRGRLAFLDVKRGRVLHRLDIKVDEPLVPMFGVLPLSDDQINMRLVSGSQLPITDTHKHLIAKALYSP